MMISVHVCIKIPTLYLRKSEDADGSGHYQIII